jgi:hypothetical protein
MRFALLFFVNVTLAFANPAAGPAVRSPAIAELHRQIVSLLLQEKTPGADSAILQPDGSGWITVVVMAVTIQLMASSLIFALAWGTRKILGGMRAVPHLSVRLLPVLATLALAALIAVLVPAMGDPIHRLGRITPWSLALFSLTLLFPALATCGLLQAWRFRAAGIHRVVWWHAFATSVFLTAVAAYLACNGLLGWQSWS